MFIVVWSRWVANSRETVWINEALMLSSQTSLSETREVILIGWLSKHSTLIVPIFTTVLLWQRKRLNFTFTTSLACVQTPHSLKTWRIETLSTIFFLGGRGGGVFLHRLRLPKNKVTDFYSIRGQFVMQVHLIGSSVVFQQTVFDWLITGF